MNNDLKIYTVSFFGHRFLTSPFALEENLEQKNRNLILTKDYVEFLVGRNGDFDQLTASTIRRIKRELDYGNSELILVLPYMTAEYRDNEKSFHDYYDDVEICYEAAQSHYKSAISVRNRFMIDRSDMVICYVNHNIGGAYDAMRYAKKQKRLLVNLNDIGRFDTL